MCVKMWYIISVLQHPYNYILSLQKVLIDYVWQSRHWVKSDRLYLRKSYGGLGLVHILSRLHAFKLRFIHKYLYYDSHSCFRIANVFLVHNCGYSKQLFLIMHVKKYVSNIPPFLSKLIEYVVTLLTPKGNTTYPRRWCTF